MPECPSELQRVFLCHSSGDKAQVCDLYRRLRNDGIHPWLDEEDLLPGQDWSHEISKAVRSSAVVLVCLSKGSITKAGFVQKEIRHVLDVADEQPEGNIFLIPVRLEDCDVPERLCRWQWVNLFESGGYDKLLKSLRVRLPSTGEKKRRFSNIRLAARLPGRGFFFRNAGFQGFSFFAGFQLVVFGCNPRAASGWTGAECSGSFVDFINAFVSPSLL